MTEQLKQYESTDPDHVSEKEEETPFNFIPANHEEPPSQIDDSPKREPEVHHLAKLNKEKKDRVKIWNTLPEKEKEYIEESAIKVRYWRRELQKSNNLNVEFYLEDENLPQWEKIDKKRKDGVKLLVGDQLIGCIHDYKPKLKRLIIKDVKDARTALKKIPDSGELTEKTVHLTSQYKQQVEACGKFAQGDIVNADLSSFLATPEEIIPQLFHSDFDIERFKREIIDDKLKNDETQKMAVAAALSKKPICLIQGPPGTGKTTVIVESVQQLIKRNRDTKILVVSQTNMAVDNVLEKLPEDISFMRLASKSAIENEKIPSKVQKHLFDEKLKLWRDQTIKKSRGHLEGLPKYDKELLDLYRNFRIEKKNIKKINQFRKLYKNKGIHVDHRNRLSDLFGSTDDLKKIEGIFLNNLGERLITLHAIQGDWFSFIQDHKSTIKNGSEDIDLQTAFCRSMSVIGSTCNHIDSGHYSRMGFKFDYMIMDESSKATCAEALVPINMSENLILIGDHKQLPPFVTREEAVRSKIKDELEDNGLDIDKTYGVSLFETLIKQFEDSDQLKEYQIMLKTQYRMPRQLGHLISQYIYNGKLKNVDLNLLPEYDEEKAHGLQLKKPMISIDGEEVPNCIIFVSTSQEENPYDNGDKLNRRNPCNLTIIQDVLKRLNNLYTDKKYTDKKNVPDIGVIAAYRAQVDLLKTKINLKEYPTFCSKIGINTVDGFQGQERDIIIYDIVRSEQGAGNTGFLDDPKRINVAFSRARKLLIVVGDSEYILKRVRPSHNPDSKTPDPLVIREIVRQLEKWGCIHSSMGDAING